MKRCVLTKGLLFKGFSLTLIIILLWGCHKESTKTIAFLSPDVSHKRFKIESEAFKAYCEPQGYSVFLKYAGNDESIQIEQAREMIAQQVDLLVVVAMNINTAAVIVREAHDAGIPVMAYNRLIKNCEVDFFMSSNVDLFAQTMVDTIVKESGGGNFVILGGDKFDKNGLDLQVAINKYLKPYSDKEEVNIIYQTNIEQWRAQKAAFEMEKVISLYGTDIDAVLVGYDGMSTAVIKVLEKYGLAGKVAVSGQDAELEACRNIVKGYQTITIYHPLREIAQMAGKIAIRIIEGEKIDDFTNGKEYNGSVDVPTHMVQSVGVTRDNLDEVLIKSGFYTKEQVYGE